MSYCGLSKRPESAAAARLVKVNGVGAAAAAVVMVIFFLPPSPPPLDEKLITILWETEIKAITYSTDYIK